MSTIRFQSIISRSFLILLSITVVSLVGCGKKKPGYEDPKPVTINEKSIAIHNIDALAKPFAFAKTMDQVVATAGGAPTTSVAMLKSVVDSFAENAFVHPISGKTIDVKPRPLESAIDPGDLLNPISPDGMIPVGLFNRFDLAPADGSNCGEYRIVYAKKSGGRLDRMTMIFEARVPNPNPSKGLAGCASITDYWAERSNDATIAQVVAALEQLYYKGIPSVEPVVQAENYGLPMGQLRVNLFKTPNPGEVPWALREFLVSFDSDGRAVFKPEPVDDSPTVSLFRAVSGSSSVFSEEDRNHFHTSFLGQSLCNLVNPDRINKNISADDIINGISAGYDPRFNDFESISQGNDDNPATDTDPQLLNQVQTRLAALSDLSGVSSTQLMNRAGTMTCGGCHQFSAEAGNNDLGNKAIWPASLGFVHIDESGALSPLLNEVFIPKRIKIAQQFKENRAAFQQETAPCPGVTVTSKKIVVSNVTKSREHNLYKNVDSIRKKMQEVIQTSEAQPDKSNELQTTLQELKEATDLARQQESASQGAYTPARTH